MVVLTTTLAMSTTTAAEPTAKTSFKFSLKRATGLTCLPKAAGTAKITVTPPNDTMTVSISGVPPNNNFTVFVLQQPDRPFGIAFYETQLHSSTAGTGSATVRGVFSVDSFAVSAGGTTTFAPTHTYHLGVWFSNPQTPFSIGCEPGATSPIITPFNTTNFPVNAGPLSHVKS